MIGYYVHHHGRGHLQRARCIARALHEDVVGLSSLAAPGAPFADWVTLPPDDLPIAPADPTAQAMVHWAPLRDASGAARTAALTAWVAEHRPRAVVVDVSVEAALTVRLAGAPVVVVAQPGDRGDRAHQLAYGIAARVIACWPRDVYDPSWLWPHLDRTAYVGALSRYDGRPAEEPGERRVLLLGGAGGRWDGLDRDALATGTPGWDWSFVDGTDAWQHLSDATVVVTHGGQNALAEVAAARRPAVVVPQHRPFGEQLATATALHAASIATTSSRWPDASAWPGLLARAQQLDPQGWGRWSTGDAAGRAARVIAGVAAAGPAW